MDEHFYGLSELPNDYYSVEKTKKKINLDLLVHLSVFNLNYAKLQMLEFYYDFLDYYLHREDFDVLEMDTDSNCLQISASNIEDLIKPELHEEFEQTSKNGSSPHSHPKAIVPLDSLKPNLKATK